MIKKSIAYAVSFLFVWSTFLCASESNTVVATIDVGQNPSGIAVTPNNLFAYVANNNNNGVLGADNVSVVDLTAIGLTSTR